MNRILTRRPAGCSDFNDEMSAEMQTISANRTTSFDQLSLRSRLLRQWCVPEVILAVTDLADEDAIQLHAIHQARKHLAKVLLVHVASPPSTRAANSKRGQAIVSLPSAQDRVESMARQLRWSGVTCEPIVVRGLQADEIPSIAKSCCADRIIVSAPDEREAPAPGGGSMTRLIEELDIPICVVGRRVPIFLRYQRPTRRITLVVSFGGHNEIPIAFASRLAQESHSQLTLMHVYPKGADKAHDDDHTESNVISRLPTTSLREAGTFCPIEIVVREGDPAEQILRYDASLNQDFIILAPPRANGPDGFGLSSVRAVLRQAHCPVFVLRESLPAREISTGKGGVAAYAS